MSVRSLYDGQGMFFEMSAHREAPATSTITRFKSHDNENSVIWSLGGMHCTQEGEFQDAFVTSVQVQENKVRSAHKLVNLINGYSGYGEQQQLNLYSLNIYAFNPLKSDDGRRTEQWDASQVTL
jgi:hypothetical protein